jgi:outer membrane protein W
LLIAGGAYGAPASGPVEKGFELQASEHNAKKPKKKKDAEEASEEAEDTDKKSKSKKGKGKKDAEEEADAEEEKPKKKGKKAKKEEPPPEEEEEKPKKKGKKGKKEEPPPEEPVDVKDTESPTATPEEDSDEMPAEEPDEEAAPTEEPKEEGEKAEASASVSSADAAGKLYLGLRLGFGIPMGKTTGDATAIEFSNKFPIWLDLGYRITPNILVALYGQFAPATLKCPEGFFCSGASVMRFGVQAQYGFAPEATIAPWVGLGVGYEIANAKVTRGGIETKFGLKGVEFMNLQVGADYMASKAVGIGPFLSFSVGRYSSGSSESEGISSSGGVEKKEFHEWLVLGLRGAFSL